MNEHVVNLKVKDFTYDKDLKTFFMSESEVPFAMSYDLFNPDTGNNKLFELSHSTGGEFQPDTRWIYKSEDGLTLEICNDPEVTKKRGKAYLEHKTRNAYG